MIRVVVAGAFGKMGLEVCRMIENEPELSLVAIIDPKKRELGTIPVFENMDIALKELTPDVFIDFTTPTSVYNNTLAALRLGIRAVVGTTGLTAEQIDEFKNICEEQGLGAIIAPNFAIGAVLMMRFAQMAAKYMSHTEIIEYHHNQKIDAPSGTAIKTAELINMNRKAIKKEENKEIEKIEGVRGGESYGIPIHSVRLPGLVAHQEVLFGEEGQLLTIRHDSFHRGSFMPGVKLAILQVMKIDQLIYGLEHIID